MTLYNPLPEWKAALEAESGKVFYLEPERGALFRVAATGACVGYATGPLREVLFRWNEAWIYTYGEPREGLVAEQTLLAQMIAQPVAVLDWRAVEEAYQAPPAALRQALESAAVYALNVPRWLERLDSAKLAQRTQGVYPALRKARALAQIHGDAYRMAVDALAPALAALLARREAGALRLPSI